MAHGFSVSRSSLGRFGIFGFPTLVHGHQTDDWSEKCMELDYWHSRYSHEAARIWDFQFISDWGRFWWMVGSMAYLLPFGYGSIAHNSRFWGMKIHKIPLKITAILLFHQGISWFWLWRNPALQGTTKLMLDYPIIPGWFVHPWIFHNPWYLYFKNRLQQISGRVPHSIFSARKNFGHQIVIQPGTEHRTRWIASWNPPCPSVAELSKMGNPRIDVPEANQRI